MPAKHFARTERVAQQIQREMADIIRTELKDPRIGLLTVTDVEVTRDYSHAKIFFTLLNDGEQLAETLKTLQRSSGFLRSELGRRINLFSVPQLHFVHDTSIANGVYLSNLIEQAVGASAPLDESAAEEDPVDDAKA